MARPAKSTKVSARHATKAEKKAREQAEEQLRGSGEVCIKPPEYLNEEQREIFRFVLGILEPVGLLNNGDVYMLAHLAIAIEREAYIDAMINEDERKMSSNALMSAREKYDKQYLRCCTELCLSPAARAKISIAAVNAQQEKSDPLLSALGGGQT